MIILVSCDKVEQTTQYKSTVPIYEKMANIRLMATSVVAPQEINKKGKIYIFKQYLFINEPQKGIHIYDNANPANPKAVSFINILGNVDIAIKDDVLYADNYVDLLSFDLSNPERPVLISRNEDVFKSVYAYNYPSLNLTDVIVGYKDTVYTYTHSSTRNPYIKDEKVYFEQNNLGAYGQGGSMARFTLAKEHLYTVDDKSLNLFDVSNKNTPIFLKNIPLGWGIETIFPYNDKLFIGSNRGMYIYDISNASAPKELSQYQHLRACDPVVVNDDYAFVTLRTGSFCAGTANVLEVVDIKDPTKPTLFKRYQMQNPHGLALSGDVLYLCEGDYGFKSFNIKDVSIIQANLFEHLPTLNSTDVIAGPQSLLVIGKDGVTQYDYTDKTKLKLLSRISIN